MKRVVLVSPWRGDHDRNRAYGLECLRDCLRRGEAPIAGHLLLTQVLDDNDPKDRVLGINAGQVWLPVADLVVAYADYGITDGMQRDIDTALNMGRDVVMRHLHRGAAE